ncbi:MAG: hypothetical protein ACON4T_04300 [Synechococcus sp.]
MGAEWWFAEITAVNGSTKPVKIALVLTMLALGLEAHHQTARAGLLQPLLQILRPRLEAELSERCSALVRETTGGLEALGILAEGPCRSAAKPISECLIREADRSGKELEVLSEVLSSKVGEHSTLVIQRCVSSLVGGPNTGQGQGQISVEEFLRQLRNETRR